jgi:PhzF family phenazine biosynthesis protein
VQECGVGLIDIAQDGSGLAFAAPPLVRFGPPDAPTRSAVVASLGIADHHVVAMSWVHNGPAWIAALLDEPSTVARLRPATAAGLMIGAAAWHGEPGTGAGPGQTDLEVRAFFPVGDELREDPVTGSLNASLGQWLTGPDAPPTPWPTPSTYVARQGAALGRDGRVRIARRGDTVWVGGDCQIVVEGTLTL